MKVQILKEKPKSFDGLWLSVSKIKTYKSCAAKYRYNYIERVPTKSWDHFVFGNFLHEVLEDFHKELILNVNRDFNKLMTDVFLKTSKKPDYTELTDEQKKESFNILKYYLGLLKIELPKVTDVEMSFFVNIDDSVLLTGLIDRIQEDDGLIHVADYKTTKNKKYLQKDHFQLLTYAYIMCLINKDISKIKTSYILLRHNFDHITKTYNRNQVMQMGDRFLKIADEINNEKLWRPNVTPLCNYCDFQDICKDGKEYKNRPRKKFLKKDSSFGFKNW